MSGHRRVVAGRQIGIEEIPVEVGGFEDVLVERLALIECNHHPEKTISQLIREDEKIEAIEQERVRRRKGNRTDIRDNCPDGDECGRTRDADMVGFNSRKTCDRARKVWDAAEESDVVAQ